MKASTTSSAVSLIRACWIAAAVTAANPAPMELELEKVQTMGRVSDA